MKRLLSLVMMLSLCLSVAIAGKPMGKPQPPQRENLNMAGYKLWGDVANIICCEYNFGEDGKWTLSSTCIYTFTEWGDVQTFEFYNEQGDLLCEENYIYDEYGRTIEKQTEYHNSWGEKSMSDYTTYADDGTAVTEYAIGATLTERYNDYGDVVYSHYVSHETNTAEIVENIYHYDGKRMMFCERIVDENSLGRTIYVYDEVGNPTYEYRFLSDDEQPDTIFVYRNDKRGNSIEEIWYGRGEITNRYENKYDKRGNLIEMIRYYGEMKEPASKMTVEIAYR